MADEPLARAPGPDAFGMLGPLEVSRSGRAVPLGGPRQRAVLALLLVQANRIVSMDRLAEDLWGGNPPRRGSPQCRPTCSTCAGRWSQTGRGPTLMGSW